VLRLAAAGSPVPATLGAELVAATLALPLFAKALEAAQGGPFALDRLIELAREVHTAAREPVAEARP
jgi:hypothetical protein